MTRAVTLHVSCNYAQWQTVTVYGSMISHSVTITVVDEDGSGLHGEGCAAVRSVKISRAFIYVILTARGRLGGDGPLVGIVVPC